jgi:hypothetical protein
MRRILFLIISLGCDVLGFILLRSDIVVNGKQWNGTLCIVVAVVGFIFAERVMRRAPSTPTRWAGGVLQGISVLLILAAIFHWI